MVQNGLRLTLWKRCFRARGYLMWAWS